MVVLGGGMVGSVIAEDLAADASIEVTVADIGEAALARVAERSNGEIAIRRADCSDTSIVSELASEADLVMGALPSWLGLAALGAVIEAGKPCCDISFMAEDARQLHEAAVQKGVVCIVDCGVAPGMSNLLAACAVATLDQCDSIDIVVGGLPKVRRWPFEYKAPFSPRDVVEEYIRPARLVVDGRVVVRPALSETEAIDMPGVGTLEAFNTDGLRSLCDTLAVPNMRERTMRYPGHAELMRVFRETGLFSEDSLTVGDATIRPIDLTSKLLLGHWAYEPGEEDLTVMRVQAEGLLGDDLVRLQWDLYDEYDPQKDQTSMGRTTAFPATSFARQILQGHRKVPGVHPPEAFGGDPGIVNRVLDDLATRGVYFHRSCESIR